MRKRSVLFLSLALFLTTGSDHAVTVPPTHVGDMDPASQGFVVGDGLPIESSAVRGFRQFKFRGLQRYRVDMEQIPATWTMTLRGAIDSVSGYGLGVAVSTGKGKAVTLRWEGHHGVTDLATAVPVNTMQLHTYQIVFDGTNASLWIDGARVVPSMPIHSNTSIGADHLNGFWIGSFSSVDASFSAWDLWKFDEGERVVPRPTLQNTDGNPIVRQIGSRLELFVDDWLIENMSGGVDLKLHQAQPRDVVLRFDKPWEGRWSGYVNVFRDGDLYRMYYRAGLDERPRIYEPESVCYAESKDGIHWVKPELDFYSFEDTKKTNIVWRGAGAHTGLGPFKDTNPDCKPNERYKALASNGYAKPVWAYASPDGVRWHFIQNDPVITEYRGMAAAYDSHFCTRWDPAQELYVTYHRVWYRPFGPKMRSVAVRTSKDFVNWSPLQLLDFGDTTPEHIYTSGISAYPRAPHILLGFPRRFWPYRKRYDDENLLPGVSDTCFMSSRDGTRFDRRFMQSFLRPGRDRVAWLSRSNTVAPGMIQTALDEMSIYVSHGWADPSQHVKRYVIRTDGFVSANARYQVGELLTKPLVFMGSDLWLNYATSAAGFMRIEVQDIDGNALPGFSLTDSPEIFGDEIAEAARWTSTARLSDLAGKPVRLRFLMKDADLFSIRFGDTPRID